MFKRFLVVLLWLSTDNVSFGNSYNVSTTRHTINTLFQNYDRYVLPPAKDKLPHLVNIRLTIKDLFDISEQSSSIRVRYYLGLSWYDTRLQFEPFVEANDTVDTIRIPLDLIKEKGKANQEIDVEANDTVDTIRIPLDLIKEKGKANQEIDV